MPSLTRRSIMFADVGSSSPLTCFAHTGIASPENSTSLVGQSPADAGELQCHPSWGHPADAPSRRPSFGTDHHEDPIRMPLYDSPSPWSIGGSPSQCYSLRASPSQYEESSALLGGRPSISFNPASGERLSSSIPYSQLPSQPSICQPSSQVAFGQPVCQISSCFPHGHVLNTCFLQLYELGAELGLGGYGFVMTARYRVDGNEVAVKFIIKSKVPDDAWMEHEEIGRIPTEIMLLSYINHENIVKCLDVFEDNLYFYLVQELHGTPWHNSTKPTQRYLNATDYTPHSASMPHLSPCVSEHSSVDSGPYTPPQLCMRLDIDCDSWSGYLPVESELYSTSHPEFFEPDSHRHSFSVPPCLPKISRPSHDLFECIEQSPHKRLTEDQARYIFAQVVEAVYHLDSQGISHRDIKDENLVIDMNLKVKLIDFGSAVIVDPQRPRPYYQTFYGTVAYASPEILRGKLYQAPPAEIWTMGVLLSFLLTGTTCFVTQTDAIKGRIVLNGTNGTILSREVLSLMGRCLEPDPRKRADIHEVRAHRWLKGALDRS